MDHLSEVPFFWVMTFLLLSLVGCIIMSVAFSVLTLKVFIYKMLLLFSDGMPIGNQWYIKEHVYVED